MEALQKIILSTPRVEIEKFNGRNLHYGSSIWRILWCKTTNALLFLINQLVWLQRFSFVECVWRNLSKFVRLYQMKSLATKLFLQRKLYLLWMNNGKFVTNHLNAFNTVVSQLTFVNKKNPKKISPLLYYVTLQIHRIILLWPYATHPLIQSLWIS